jgi:cytochrome c553
MLFGCSAPVILPSAPDGEVVAFGGGPGGAADACFTCHGLKGQGDGDAPRLAGQSAGYLIKQMEDYASRWRRDSQMAPVAARLSDPDRIAVAQYYATLDSRGAGEPLEETRGERLFLNGDAMRGIRACSDCHAASGHGGLATPRLAGQPAVYIRAQLAAWKISKRRNDPQDIMGALARRLTCADIDALARYVESMP